MENNKLTDYEHGKQYGTIETGCIFFCIILVVIMLIAVFFPSFCEGQTGGELGKLPIPEVEIIKSQNVAQSFISWAEEQVIAVLLFWALVASTFLPLLLIRYIFRVRAEKKYETLFSKEMKRRVAAEEYIYNVRSALTKFDSEKHAISAEKAYNKWKSIVNDK